MNDDVLMRLVRRADPCRGAEARLDEKGARKVLEEVMLRVRVPEEPRTPFRRRRRLMVAIVAAALVSGAGSAFAAHELLSQNPIEQADFVPAAGSTVITHAAQVVDGGTWALGTYSNAEGQQCFSVKTPKFNAADTAQGEQEWDECIANANAGKTLIAQLDAQQSPGPDTVNHWTHIVLFGRVKSDVAKVALQFYNCQTAPVEVDSSGVFQDVLPEASLAGGNYPLNVLAYDAAGNVVATEPLDLAQGGTGSPTNGKPVPEPTCPT